MVLALSPPTQWFPCTNCHVPVPVVVPRDPPPLFAWEVFPGLYPTLPRPRLPRWRARSVTAVALFAVVVLAVAFGGVFAFYGYVAASPASYEVSGTVYAISAGGTVGPAAGAQVLLTENGGGRLGTTTGLGGVFGFSGVPAGGVVLNVTLSGYAPAEVDTFVSAVYDAGTQGISVTLAPGGPSNGSTLVLSAFPSLESFLASLGAAVALLGLVTVVALVAGWETRRHDRPALGVVGGGAGITAPVALYLLGLAPVFPYLFGATALLAAFGAFALSVRAVELAQTGPALGPE